MPAPLPPSLALMAGGDGNRRGHNLPTHEDVTLIPARQKNAVGWHDPQPLPSPSGSDMAAFASAAKTKPTTRGFSPLHRPRNQAALERHGRFSCFAARDPVISSWLRKISLLFRRYCPACSWCNNGLRARLPAGVRLTAPPPIRSPHGRHQIQTCRS
jgi:hypothetical protein